MWKRFSLHEQPWRVHSTQIEMKTLLSRLCRFSVPRRNELLLCERSAYVEARRSCCSCRMDMSVSSSCRDAPCHAYHEIPYIGMSWSKPNTFWILRASAAKFFPVWVCSVCIWKLYQISGADTCVLSFVFVLCRYTNKNRKSDVYQSLGRSLDVVNCSILSQTYGTFHI